jgi:thymidylate kinase
MHTNRFPRHKLMLFAGSSPGAGKSTLSALVARQLVAAGVDARWLHEEEMGDLLDSLVPELAGTWPAPEPLLRAAEAFVDWCAPSDATFVADSVLPWYVFLYGRHPRDEIEAWSARLGEVLRPLQPLVVYLRIDPVTALARAVEQRGQRWIENIIGWVNTWPLPYAEALPRPFRTLDDLAALFSRADELALALLPRWPAETLILDTTDIPTPLLLGTLLRHIGLVDPPIDQAAPAEDLAGYTGTYLPSDEAGSQPLHITLVDGHLVVDTYWPGGTRLRPEGEGRFRLESTNRHLVFRLDTARQPRGLTYTLAGKVEHFRREE